MLALIPAASAATSDLVEQINWSEPTWDLFIILFFVIAALLYGLSLGRNRIIAIMVSIYMTLAVINAFPLQFFGNEVRVNETFALQIGTFIAIFLGLFFILSRSALSGTILNSGVGGRWWQVIIFSFLQVGMLISVVLSFLPADILNNLTLVTRSIFIGEWQEFLWIASPVVAMIIMRDKHAAPPVAR